MPATEPLPRDEALESVIDIRPWGGFRGISYNEPSTVKIIWVEPGKRLSLQSHKKRSELWTVIDGEMDVELDGKVIRAKKDDQVFIPCGAKHRAVGLDAPCRWIEIAFGYFDEADIVRYEDDFGRA